MKHLQDSPSVITKARCLYYDFFSRVFLYELLEDSKDKLLFSFDLMSQSPLQENLQEYYEILIKTLKHEGILPFKQAYTACFIMPTHNERVHLILSHYITHNVGGEILLDLKAFFRQLPIRLNQDFCKESEEHFGFLMSLMGYLLIHEESKAQELFTRFIAPYAKGIANASIQSGDSLYGSIGHILDAFIDFEKNLYGLS